MRKGFSRMLIRDLRLLHSVFVQGITQVDALLVLLRPFLADCRRIHQQYIFHPFKGRSINCWDKRRKHGLQNPVQERGSFGEMFSLCRVRNICNPKRTGGCCQDAERKTGTCRKEQDLSKVCNGTKTTFSF